MRVTECTGNKIWRLRHQTLRGTVCEKGPPAGVKNLRKIKIDLHAYRCRAQVARNRLTLNGSHCSRVTKTRHHTPSPTRRYFHYCYYYYYYIIKISENVVSWLSSSYSIVLPCTTPVNKIIIFSPTPPICASTRRRRLTARAQSTISREILPVNMISNRLCIAPGHFGRGDETLHMRQVWTPFATRSVDVRDDPWYYV